MGDLDGNGIIGTGVDIFIPYDPGYDSNFNGKYDLANINDTDPNDGPINLKGMKIEMAMVSMIRGSIKSSRWVLSYPSVTMEIS